ncbi:MAG: signal peptide peptidase SppA [Candidatus Paceibacterota bacterium]
MHKFKQTLIKIKTLTLKFLSRTFAILLAFLIISASSITVFKELGRENSKEDSDCNVLGIELHGFLTTYIPESDYGENGRLLYDQTASENIIAAIENAEKNKDIKAILLEVDSGGGSGVSDMEVANALKRATKPTAAIIRSIGASAAYMASTGAGRIFASRDSEIGSIGVTMSYLDNSQKNEKDGIAYNELSSGKFKDTGTSYKPLSKEERRLLMRDITISYQNFIENVAENRNLSIKDVKKIADGSTMLGQMALEHGLIDEIGGYDEAKAYLSKKIGEEVEVCWN